jgi:hypothetical protein
MFEQLMNIVRQSGRQPVVENPAVPDQYNEPVMEEAGNSIFSKLKNFAANGDTDNLAGMLRGNPSSAGVAEVKQDFAGNIARKFGINPGSAMDVANNLIPAVLGSLIKRKGQAGNGFDLSSMLSSLTGGGTPGQPGMLQSLGHKLGLDKDGDGDVDLNDIKGMFRR